MAQNAGASKNYEAYISSGTGAELVKYLIKCGILKEEEVNTKKGKSIVRKFKNASSQLSMENNTLNRHKKSVLKSNLKNYLQECDIITNADLGTVKEYLILAKFDAAEYWVTNAWKDSGENKGNKTAQVDQIGKVNDKTAGSSVGETNLSDESDSNSDHGHGRSVGFTNKDDEADPLIGRKKNKKDSRQWMQVAVRLICHFMEIVYASLSLMNAFIYPLEKKKRFTADVQIYKGKNNAARQARI